MGQLHGEGGGGQKKQVLAPSPKGAKYGSGGGRQVNRDSLFGLEFRFKMVVKVGLFFYLNALFALR